ncbi:hypothetical protein [Foetidibacter luteolus]|uniref:hypothetical protein n=1 Tax=Foetidibacter luteolus TaxID=2608880 RepID=UPI00129A65E2|nr:hypothetical protein [Foetidibacter luteolus]
MKTVPNLPNNPGETSVIDENGSLQKFYSLTHELSKSRHVRFTGKTDEADNIAWRFKYRGRELTLQYSIYNGVTLQPVNSKDSGTAYELAVKLKSK